MKRKNQAPHGYGKYVKLARNAYDLATKYGPSVVKVVKSAKKTYDVLKGAKRQVKAAPRAPKGQGQYVLQSRPLRNYGAGKAAGKFRKPRRRIKRGGSITKMIRHTEECGSEITDDQCVYVGHGTFPTQQIVRAGFRALVKVWLRKLGIEYENPESPLASQIAINDFCRIKYYLYSTEVNVAPSTMDFTYTNVVAGNNWFSPEELATKMEAAWKSLILITASPNPELLSIEWLPASPTTTTMKYQIMYLRGSSINIYVKSSLKMQNRTVGATGDTNAEADEVDNQPLYGKCYQGKGTGSTLAGQRNLLLKAVCFIHPTYGAFHMSGSDVPPAGTDEPIDPALVYRATRYDKVMLNPGEIKSSILVDRFRITLDRLLLLFNSIGASNTAPDVPKGHFKMYAFEKMLENYVGVRTNVNVNWEHNLNIESTFTQGKLKQLSTRTFTGGVYVGAS